MNKLEILTMPAGREMDALMAEKVFQYTLDYEFEEITQAPNVKELRSIHDEWGLLPNYNTDIADAWIVFIRLGQGWEIRQHDKSFVCVDAKNWNGGTLVEAETAPLAICRAALLDISG